MQGLRSRLERVPGWVVLAVVILALAMLPGLWGGRIDGDPYRKQDQDLLLLIGRWALGLVTGLFILTGAVSAVIVVLMSVHRRQPIDHRLVLSGAVLGAALLGVVLGGVLFGAPTPQRDGVAQVHVADVTVGRSDNEVTCYGQGPGVQPQLVASKGAKYGLYTGTDRWYQWFPRGLRSGSEVRLLLELTDDGPSPARAEVAIGSSVFRSTGTPPAVLDLASWIGEDGSPVNRWPSGVATFEAMPLVSGPPWAGNETVSLWVQWACDKV